MLPPIRSHGTMDEAVSGEVIVNVEGRYSMGPGTGSRARFRGPGTRGAARRDSDPRHARRSFRADTSARRRRSAEASGAGDLREAVARSTLGRRQRPYAAYPTMPDEITSKVDRNGELLDQLKAR